MTILVTGSSGHLGEALMRALRAAGREAVGLDLIAGPFTDEVGSIAERACVARCVDGALTVLHAATLHKPHVATHSREDFVETNIIGTLILLEEAVRAGVRAFVFTSTTSVFGDALRPAAGRTGGLDRRERRSDSEKHLRRHQERRRGPLRAVSPQRRPALRRR